MKYRPHQYDTSACASVGGVCPAVLNCDVRPISAHGTMRGRDCVVSLLPHVGWNPSVLPLELAPQAARVVRKAYPHAQYLATSLSSANGGPNNRVRCPNTEFANSELPGKGSNRMFANTLHFLDDQFRQLDRLHPRSLNGTGTARGSDCRLFASGGDALLTFTNHWNPRGHFIGRLAFIMRSWTGATVRDNLPRHKVAVDLLGASNVGDQRDTKMVAPRNSGVFVDGVNGSMVGEHLTSPVSQLEPGGQACGHLACTNPNPYPNSSQVGELVDVSPDVWLHLNVRAKKARGRRKPRPPGFQEMRLPAPLSFGSWLRAQAFSLLRLMSQSGGFDGLSTF